MPERTNRQPFSGKIIEAIQNRYTQQRVASKTDSAYSTSEWILQPFKAKGLLRGLPYAWQRAEIQWGNRDRLYMLSLGTVEFFLIAAGIGTRSIMKDGHWK